MAFERSLLERIDKPDPAEFHRLSVDSNRLAQSVVDHLTKMLNVRQGSAPTVPDYGMPDLNDVFATIGDPIGMLRRCIRYSIERFEPRLDQVLVRHVPDPEDPLTLRFAIVAVLITGDREAPVAFETLVDDAGCVRVRG